MRLASDSSIQFRDVTLSLDDRILFDKLNVTLRCGETAFILGRSGAGKSMFLRCCSGTVKPDHGAVFFNGMDLSSLSPEAARLMRRQIPLIGQRPALLDRFTLRGNIELVAREAKHCPEDQLADLVERTAERVGLSIDDLDKKPGSVSLTALKLAAVARATVLEPGFILFDEPDTGLDARLSDSLYRLIESLVVEKGTGAVIVTHDPLAVVGKNSRVLFLHDGRFIWDGPVSTDDIHREAVMQEFFREV